MDEDFSSFTFEDFKQNFLLENDLDKSPHVRLGELSRTLSNTNIDVARKLNSWAAKIAAKVGRYSKRISKRPETAKINMRHINVADGKTETASMIIINIEGVGEIETSVFDNNQIAIRMSDEIAKAVNKGRKRKFLSSKDKVADYLIGILEKVA